MTGGASGIGEATVAGSNTLQYDTSKAAVTGLTRGLARDHAPDGIRVNAVCPGPISTPFFVQLAAEVGKTLEELQEDLGRGTMLRRMGTSREVAACVLFLASDDASYVTGASLLVDGGQTAW
ncbi:MAG: SDR family oxidoreductase [Dehalococcoidia bacterium]|nr:SDR family oxidoreductase [Dehalococcoidia bacterium]